MREEQLEVGCFLPLVNAPPRRPSLVVMLSEEKISGALEYLGNGSDWHDADAFRSWLYTTYYLYYKGNSELDAFCEI